MPNSEAYDNYVRPIKQLAINKAKLLGATKAFTRGYLIEFVNCDNYIVGTYHYVSHVFTPVNEPFRLTTSHYVIDSF